MKLLRKIGSWILLILAVLGLLICIGGIVGSWVGKSAIDATSTDVLISLEGYLTSAETALGRVGDRLTQTQARVSALATKTEEIVQSGGSPAKEALEAALGDDFGSRLAEVRAAVGGIGDMAVSLNEMLIGMNRVPGVDVPTFTAQVEALNAKTDAIAARGDELQSAVAEINGERILAATSSISEGLADVETTLAESQAKISETKAQIETVRSDIPWYTSLLALALSLFLLLMAAGQASLIGDCWRWARQ